MEEMSWNCIAAAENNSLSTSLWELQDSNNSSWRGVFKWEKIANNSNQYVADLEVIKQSSIEAYFSSAIQTSPLNCEQITEDLAQRILEHVLGVNTAESQLLASELPPQLPIKLPLPENTEIIGSLYTDDHFRILLEVPESPERVELFYQHQLSSDSWEKCEIPPRISKQSGFMSSGYKPFEMNIFCHRELGWELFFNTHPSQPNHTDLRLEIRKITPETFCEIHPTEDVSLLNQESQEDILEALIKQISLPILIAPEKAEVLFLNPIGGSGIQYSHKRDGKTRLGAYFSNAFVKTQLSIEDLAAHYFDQMPKYNWEKVSEIKQGKIAVGLWTFQNQRGDTFQAAIDVIQNQNLPQQYSANLRIVPIEEFSSIKR